METEAEKAARLVRTAAARRKLAEALKRREEARERLHDTASGTRGAVSRKSEAESSTPIFSAAVSKAT